MVDEGPNKEFMERYLIDLKRQTDFQASLMWENLKFYSSITVAAVTAYVVVLGLFIAIINVNKLAILITIALPALMIITSVQGERDLRRRWRRMLEVITTSAKIEEYVGLRSKRNFGPKVFPKDEWFISPRFVESESKYEKAQDFVEGETIPKNDSNMYTHMRTFYISMGIFAGVLIGVSITIAVVGL